MKTISYLPQVSRTESSSSTFEGKSTVRKAELISKYKKNVWGDGNDDDAVKFAILYFINTFIYSSEKKNSSIPRIQFDLVESGQYHEYPWKRCFLQIGQKHNKKNECQETILHN
ncbi:hypothetical protein H5410_000418 [Solanum commersonii]|uniref:DUF1985 domain-containing protein n=1 Tax=Solanum commersonii TaxID=4109 RepID=A0A9J6AVT8_SOLCO|nr:hypothetical protein H5410_000418 [Solanum commersonii]